MNVAKFYIYRNLRTGGFSIKHHGRVIKRDNFFIAENVTFKVNESGRQRVIQEKRKNVHAYTVCDKYISARSKDKVDKLRIITYNPYKSANFTCEDCSIETARKVLFKDGKCYLLE
jgi:hypothetical protein